MAKKSDNRSWRKHISRGYKCPCDDANNNPDCDCSSPQILNSNNMIPKGFRKHFIRSDECVCHQIVKNIRKCCIQNDGCDCNSVIQPKQTEKENEPIIPQQEQVEVKVERSTQQSNRCNRRTSCGCGIHRKLLLKLPKLPTRISGCPIYRGMLAYAILWPLGSLIQDYIECGTTLENANWWRAMRFSFFGAIFLAPTLHLWLAFANQFVNHHDIKSAIYISLLGQLTYTPFAFVYFYFGMSLLEMKTVKESIDEVKTKFWPTYKVSWIYWPAVQMLTFFFIPANMRVVTVCFFSFLWTIFLAHMKARNLTALPQCRCHNAEGTDQVPASSRQGKRRKKEQCSCTRASSQTNSQKKSR